MNSRLLCLPLVLIASASFSQVIPGTGTRIDYVGDDFEDPGWEFVHNMPKGSYENDELRRGPMGYSRNGRFMEGPERGQPDHMQIIPTPEGGPEGSEYALWVSTLHSGIPRQNTRSVEQDDLIVNCTSRLKTSFRPSESPNCLVRIYFPEADRWERRSGPHFGFRLGCQTTAPQEAEGFLGLFGGGMGPEPYWPGIWVHYRNRPDKNGPAGSAFLAVRSDSRGRDFRVAEMEQFGWWTFGISVTPDGMVHYYASPGVDPLTASDRLTSQAPYGFDAEMVTSFFFNFCNTNDGRTWSTPIVIDNPEMYLVNASRIMQIVKKREAYEQRKKEMAERRKQMMANRSSSSKKRRN